MDSKQLNQVRVLFEQVMNLAPSEAKSYLDKNCSDKEVRSEIDFLLDKHRTASQLVLKLEPNTRATIEDTPSSFEHYSSSSMPYFTDLLGQTLNNTYLIEKQIGQGGMGVVFCGKHLFLGNEVAIKVMPPTIKKSVNDIKRFQREARVGWSLSHPNIIKVFEFSQTQDGILFMVMELIKGENLKSYIKRFAPLPLNRCLELLKPLCSALSVAHKRNVLHRDLKPANILISKEDGLEVVKLADFGIAKLLKSDDDTSSQSTVLTTEGTIIGSLDYMSPEQLMGYKLAPSSDIYSLGVILYEMLIGQLPIQGSTPQEILKLKTTYDKQPPPSTEFGFLPKSLDEVLQKVLAPLPQKRYQNVEALLSAFSACL